MKPSELIADPKCWTKGEYARDTLGNGVDANSREATCWCAMGAMRRCGFVAPGDMRSVADVVRKKLPVKAAQDNFSAIVLYNDMRSHEEVVAVFKEAGL